MFVLHQVFMEFNYMAKFCRFQSDLLYWKYLFKMKILQFKYYTILAFIIKPSIYYWKLPIFVCSWKIIELKFIYFQCKHYKRVRVAYIYLNFNKIQNKKEKQNNSIYFSEKILSVKLIDKLMKWNNRHSLKQCIWKFLFIN